MSDIFSEVVEVVDNLVADSKGLGRSPGRSGPLRLSRSNQRKFKRQTEQSARFRDDDPFLGRDIFRRVALRGKVSALPMNGRRRPGVDK